jgi:hypothetical protein
MPEHRTGVRKFVTRVMAAGALLALYCVSTATVTTGLMMAGMTSADAQWRRGRGWRGRRGWRGWRGRRGVVCRHRYWSTRRVCFVR